MALLAIGCLYIVTRLRLAFRKRNLDGDALVSVDDVDVGADEEDGVLADNQAPSPFNTMLVPSDPNGERVDVGGLLLNNEEDVSLRWPKSQEPCFFISQTDRDNVKNEISRPTFWFLKEILGVKVFLDECAAPGLTIEEALTKPAYQCTHALLILTPTFQQREYCVRELNTFMARHRRHDGIRVLPCLWGLRNLDGFHSDVHKLVWIRNESTKYFCNYLVLTLWPKLVLELQRPKMSTKELESHLVRYVELHRDGQYGVPTDLETFVRQVLR